MNQLDFTHPFTGFANLNFISCFASAYVHINQIPTKDDYECAQKSGCECNGCMNCLDSTAKTVEQYYFLFDTFTGRSSLRMDYDNQLIDISNAPETVEFCMGYAGYAYCYITTAEDIEDAIKASISDGFPAIAVMKEDTYGKCRVIIGYDADNNPVMAPPTGAKNPPEKSPSYDEMEGIYIINGKIKPKYHLIDGLYNIRRTMQKVKTDGIWNDLKDRVQFWDYNLGALSFADFKKIFERMEQICWYNFNSHNFAEVFRCRIIPELQDERFNDACQKIGGPCYGWFHDLNWGIIGAHVHAKWDEAAFQCGSYRPGLCELV